MGNRLVNSVVVGAICNTLMQAWEWWQTFTVLGRSLVMGCKQSCLESVDLSQVVMLNLKSSAGVGDATQICRDGSGMPATRTK